MGNTSIHTKNDIKYMQTLEDENFGNIDIYKNEEGKYIMNLQRTFMKDSANKFKDYGFNEMLDYISLHKQSQQFITPILHSVKKIQSLCTFYQVIDTYCEYFNFTLADMIRHKKQMDKEQIWLTFHWLLKLVVFLKQKGWVLQEGIKLNKIFITLKGTPTISIHHLRKSSECDQVFQKQRKSIDDVGLCILQLGCMTMIPQNSNLQLFLRKVQKVDPYFQQILGSILRKSVIKKKCYNQHETLYLIQKLLQEQKIAQSNEIKLNKFRYVIPKPEIKTQKSEETEKKNIQQKIQRNQSSTKQQKQKPIMINSLGRKNRENLSLRGSNKRDTFDTVDSRLSAFNMNTPMNKTMSIKNALLMDEIEIKKKQTQMLMQKMNHRKQIIMNSKPKTDKNKQNLLGNSIRQIKPSLNKNQSWTKKVLDSHLKQSQRC